MIYFSCASEIQYSEAYNTMHDCTTVFILNLICLVLIKNFSLLLVKQIFQILAVSVYTVYSRCIYYTVSTEVQPYYICRFYYL